MPDSPAATGTDFPLDSFRLAAPHLRRPFTPEAVKFKVTHGSSVATYIDARLVVERLNMVVPDLWFDEYEPVAGGKGLLCRLTVDGITRLDVGENYTGKGLYSDALKRAAVKFGVGVSLYAIPQIKMADQHLRKEGKSTVITPDGITKCRDLYEGWLDTIGKGKFGDVLDHGDVADAVGDVEVEESGPDDAPPVEPAPEPVNDAKAKALNKAAQELYASLSKDAKKGIETKAAFNRALAGAGDSHEKLEAFIADLEKRAKS